MVSLSDISGLWRRRLIAWPQGEADTTTEVYWLQGPELYADLRIPERRPRCKATCLRELDRKMLGFLARQEGFFGKLDVQVSIGHWHRAFDYQPDTGRQDRGHLAFEGDILVERGVEAPYIEHWVREPHTDECMALSLETDAPSRTGCLILAGDAFMYARSRSAKLPPGADLTECLKAAGSLQAAAGSLRLRDLLRSRPATVNGASSDRAFPSGKVIACDPTSRRGPAACCSTI